MLDLNDAELQRSERPWYNLDELSDRLAECAPQWVPDLFPNGPELTERAFL